MLDILCSSDVQQSRIHHRAPLDGSCKEGMPLPLNVFLREHLARADVVENTVGDHREAEEEVPSERSSIEPCDRGYDAKNDLDRFATPPRSSTDEFSDRMQDLRNQVIKYTTPCKSLPSWENSSITTPAPTLLGPRRCMAL